MSADKDFLKLHIESMGPHRAILRSVEAKLMSRVPLEHPILDVGVGDGHFASIAYDEPIDVGIDVFERDLREAAARKGVYRSLALASAAEMPFSDGVFKTVVSNCVIEHIPDLDAVLREIHRVLSPGGLFAATVPSQHFAEYLLGSTIFRKIRLSPLARAYGNFFNKISKHYHIYSPERWKSLLESVGFQVLEQRYYFSPGAHRVFDLCHYIAAPMWVTKRLFGKWVVHPIITRPLEPLMRRFYVEPWPEQGAYHFFLARKTPGGENDLG